MSDGKGKPPSGDVRHVRKPVVARHAHDEFEIDIDLDTDFTELASRPFQDLSFDEDDVTSEISQEELASVIEKNSDLETIIPVASDEKVLPLFLSSRSNTPSEPLSRTFLPEADPPDLSDDDNAEISVSSVDAYMSNPDELFGDVSGIHDKPPVHQIDNPNPDPLDALTDTPEPVTQPPSSKKFSRGFTAGMAPLNMTDFSSYSSSKKSSPGRGKSSAFLRRGPAPMAYSNRVVRRWYQPNLRDILLFLLVVLLGVGIWLGWKIYQDYKRTLGWERFDRGRISIEQARMDAIKSKQPKFQRDIP